MYSTGTDRRTRAVPIIAVVALLVVSVAPVAAVPPPTDHADTAPVTDAAAGDVSPDTLVVDADGGADYRSIAAAVSEAGDGDTVRVRPGTYDGGIALDANVTVVAPRGATIAASEDDPDRAFTVVSGSRAAPTVSGFTVVGFDRGVYAWDTSGDWVVRDTTFRNVWLDGIEAARSTGDWRVEGVVVRNVSSGQGISALDTAGDWTVRDTAVHRTEHGIEAPSASGAWTLRNVTVTDSRVALNAQNASSEWRVVNSAIRNVTVGVSAYRTSGDWTVADSRFRNVTRSERYDFLMPPLPEGVAIFAGDATGNWTVRGTTVTGVTGPAVDATGARTAGNATSNPWSDDRCVGNVDCHGAASEDTPTASATSGTDERDAGPTGPPATTDGSTSTDSPEPGSPPPDSGTTTAPGTTMTGDGPLPAWPAVVILVLVGGLFARRYGGRLRNGRDDTG